MRTALSQMQQTNLQRPDTLFIEDGKMQGKKGKRRARELS